MIDAFKDEHAFLSNFFPCDVEMHYMGEQEIIFPTAEHAFVAAKTTDHAEREYIATIKTPGKAKRYGRETISLRSDWDDVRIAAMHKVLQQKFYENTGLAHLLLDTRGNTLVEGNHWGDQFWGMVEDPRAPERGDLIGQNWLGQLLMLVRSTFLLEESDVD